VGIPAQVYVSPTSCHWCCGWVAFSRLSGGCCCDTSSQNWERKAARDLVLSALADLDVPPSDVSLGTLRASL